jgi:hypothetical protein
VALPANEYFDDECISDLNSSLGAFIQHHFKDRVDDLIQEVQNKLIDVPSQRVPRAERRIGESYGIGEVVFLNIPPGATDSGVSYHRADGDRTTC